MKIFLILISLLFSCGQVYAQLRDVKPPVAVPSLKVFWVSLLILFVFSGVLFFIVKRLRAGVNLKPKKALSAWEKAQKQLDALEREGLVKEGLLGRYYSNLSDILRRYIEERFSIRAPEMTTEEFLQHLQLSSDLNPNQKESLKKFLESCDMVKFAKYAPDPSEAKQSFELAAAFIDETTPKETVE